MARKKYLIEENNYEKKINNKICLIENKNSLKTKFFIEKK